MSDHIPGPGKMVSARSVVARAMLDSLGLSGTSAAQGEDNADAILTAFAADGYAVVPVEPTPHMAKEGVRAQMRDNGVADIYRAMFAAAKETQA